VLTIDEAWSNEEPGSDRAFAIWLVGRQQSGDWWWILALIAAKQLGLAEIRVRSVSDPRVVQERIADDEAERRSTPWSKIDAIAGVERVATEYARARGSSWATEYPDQFARVTAEFARWTRALQGSEPLVSYERGRTGETPH
jgi:hypothetical protein